MRELIKVGTPPALRVDVCTLQSALLEVKSHAERLLVPRAEGHPRTDAEVNEVLTKMVEICHNTVFVAKQSQEDNELLLLQEK